MLCQFSKRASGMTQATIDIPLKIMVKMIQLTKNRNIINASQ